MLNVVHHSTHYDDTDALDDERKLSDIVEKLCNSTTNEERAHLASQLRIFVDCITDIGELNVKSSHVSDFARERGPVVTALNRRLQRLLVSDKQTDRLAAIAAFTALINTESESIQARAQRAANAVRVLFETPFTDIATAKAAAGMVGELSNVNSPLPARAVDHILTNAINIIGNTIHEAPHPQLSNDRARSAMIIAELAGVDKAPKFVFRFQEKLRKALWQVVWDRQRFVREQGVQGLLAILKTVIVRGDRLVAEKAMKDVMDTIRRSLSSLPVINSTVNGFNDPHRDHINVAVIHGSLSTVASLLSAEETARYLRVLSSELCTLSLRFQKSSNALIRDAVAEILPLLVRLDSTILEGEYLSEVHQSTLELVNNHSFPGEERARSLLSLAATAEQIPSTYHASMVEDMLIVCEKALTAHRERDDKNFIPKRAILKTISHLARASRGNAVFEEYMRTRLLSLMFSSDFTSDLVVAVDHVERTVPSLKEKIQDRLVNLIAATLRSRMYDRDVAIMVTSGPHQDRERRSANGSLSKNHSMPTLNGPIAKSPQEAKDPLEVNLQLRASKASNPRNFFRQYPFSPELHRIDSGAALASSVSSTALDGLVRSPPDSRGSSPSSNEGILSLPSVEDDPLVDKENSPCVALKAIVKYDFDRMKAQDITSFANEFVISYVESRIVKVRALAVAASAKLMETAATVWSRSRRNGTPSQQLRPEIQSILVQLLLLSVADPSKDVRYVAIRSLDKRVFWPYLLQPEMLDTLFMCFHDESLAIKNSVISVAGELSRNSPAHAVPALRRFLIQLMTTLKFEGDYFERDRRDATKLIYTMVHSTTRLVELYTDSVMESLLLRLHEAKQQNDNGSALPVLLTIAEMGGAMNRIDLKPYRASLVPLIVSSVLQVQSAESQYRQAALRALSAIVQNTGFVIKPYVEHPDLLPGLLEMLRVEPDARVRLEAETLIGSLGAVDPDDHKYAAIPMYSGARSTAKNYGSGTQSKSSLRLDNQSAQLLSQRGGSGPRLLSTRGPHQRLPSGMYRQRQGQSGADSRGVVSSSVRSGRVYFTATRAQNSDSAYGGDDLKDKLDEGKPSISLFAEGAARLGMITDYVPVWDRRELRGMSLVGQLEHPFTASPEYFASAALDLLHAILSNPRLRGHHSETSQAIVNVVKSVGGKVSYYLPAVIPRMLWLLGQSSRSETTNAVSFSQLQQHVMQRLGDIIRTAGYAFVPYTVDTVLLIWYYLKNVKDSPACIVSLCSLLSRLRNAIGDEFKPIIATMLPPLLAAMAQDRTSDAATSRAVFRALESFNPLYEEYGAKVLTYVTQAISTKRSATVRQEALVCLVRLLEGMPLIEVLPVVMHSLIRILSGVNDESAQSDDGRGVTAFHPLHDRRVQSSEEKRLALLAATALLEIGNRATHGFDVFVPVIAKAMSVSAMNDTTDKIFISLENLLMQTNPDVVSDLLQRPVGEIERQKRWPCPKESPEWLERRKLVQEVVPLRRGGALDGQALLPRGTRTRNIGGVFVSEVFLMQKWEVDHTFTSEDWVRWIAGLGAAMFAESGSPAFRGCVRISESYPQFTKHLFNAAFLSCWVSPLTQSSKSRICRTLEKALISDTIPLNVLQALLNLFEYMDHDEKPLPAGPEKLASTACKCGALAKAVRYRERDYAQHFGMPELLEQDINGEDGLIAIYEKLGHIESAVGTISHYQKQTGEKVKEKWFEKLQRWDDALQVYEKESKQLQHREGENIYSNKHRWENELGRLRCLNELGEWHQMNDLLLEARASCEGNKQALRELALRGKGVSVALDLGRWEEFEEWVGYLHPDTFEGCFYKAILMVRYGKENPSSLNDAVHYVHEARKKLDLDLIARVSEGYPRAYSQVIEAQILVELEEMISFLRRPAEDALFGLQRLRSLWDDRLQGCKRDRYTWYRLLMIRTLVMAPVDDKQNWLSFSTLCRKTNRLPMASQALQMLLASHRQFSPRLGYNPGDVPLVYSSDVDTDFEKWNTRAIENIEDLDIRFACIKHLWAIDMRYEAYTALENSGNHYLSDAGLMPMEGELYATRKCCAKDSGRTLAGEVFSKLSKWGDRLIEKGEFRTNDTEDPLQYASYATKIRPQWYKAWHYWAQLNATRFEALVQARDRSIGPRIRSGAGPTYQPSLGGTHLEPAEERYITGAVRGYFRAIDLEGKSRLEDSLKVLTLWFNYGGLCGLHTEFDRGFRETNIAQWLEVVPQIIARLYTPFPQVQRGVKTLLTRIGTEHPHVAVYPLTVAKSTVGSHQQKRSMAATEILQELKQHHEEIVEQAELVATELVRVAVLWTETWYESLEEASKMYFINRNVDEMLESLLPLHEQLEYGGDTPFEKNFKAEFGAELKEAGDLCKRFRIEHRRGMASDETLRQYLNQAWQVYHEIFRRIQRQQQSMHVFDLAHVSNGLHDASGLLLAVPGTYHPDENVPVVGIQSFSPQLKVIQSKQRPRKLMITGSDGREYQFLLKGHEDLRQDERVMQVFGLINKLFEKSDQRTILRGVGLKTYSVIALSANAGLIEWVPNCDTMHALVKEYREVRKVMPNIEQRVMLRIAPEPDRLPLLHKVDLFEFMLQNTGGVDIAKVLWLKSRNSEMWLDRRTTYAKSLATTSMTGYLLGLGDRHPSNLTIERSTGKIMHIDYGDCFEVAMKREKYPEKVPFRLTRMLVEALEPCGIDGYFRHTSEATLEVVREHDARESLMSMMEAFVYDPLIRWKLIGTNQLVQIRHEEAVTKGQQSGGAPMNGAGIVGKSSAAESEIVRSLHEKGSLRASLRAMNARQTRQATVEGQAYPGAIPTGSSHAQGVPSAEAVDPAEMRTPRDKTRLEIQRLLRAGEPVHNRITDVSNAKAQHALSRFADKLCGTDFNPDVALTVPKQVDLLIREAQNIENLCQLFLGWCAFW